MMLLHDLYDDEMRKQQEMLLLWLLLGEYGLILSHTLHDVAGVDAGTIMVQRGYSLALEDQEVLPLWKEPPICRNIMVCEFGIGHVKERSYEMARALSQRPTMMSLGCLDLLMECSQD